MRDGLQLELVHRVLAVDQSLDGRVFADTRTDVLVQHRVGKAQIILVRLAGKAVGRGLFHKVAGQAENLADSLHLLHREAAQGGKVAGGISVAGAVTHPILGEVAGIGHTAVVALGDGIQGRHTQAGGHVDARLGAGRMPQLVLHLGHEGLEGGTDIDVIPLDSQMFDQLDRVRDIRLDTVGHGDADDTVLAQSLNAQGGADAAVLASGNAYHGIATFTILLEPVADPLDARVLYFFCVKHKLFSSCIYLDGAAFKVEVLAELVLQEALVGVLHPLRQVAEESKLGSARGQLRHIFDLDVFTLPCRRRVVLDFRQHGVVELAGGNLPGHVGGHAGGGVQHIQDALLVEHGSKDDGDVVEGS